MKLCIVQPSIDAISETFLHAHANILPFDTTVVHYSKGLPCIEKKPILSQSFIPRAIRKLKKQIMGRTWECEFDLYFAKVFKEKADIILAEYGPTGVLVSQAANMAKKPLVVHFHGYDASRYDVLNTQKLKYKELFRKSAGIVAVSNKMVDDLVMLGAAREKVHLNPCGVDTQHFQGANPEESKSVFLAVGRFVEKKAPYLSILAFSQVLKEYPQAKLRMVGKGILLGPCRDLVHALGIESSVTFLGGCSHQQVKDEMLSARAFIQHSIQSSDGDCEGTPVTIMEAQSMGLPVIATKHAGIADVVVNEDTGFLVEEKDVNAMARNMLKIVKSPALAKKMGASGRKRILKNYSMKISIDKLTNILKNAKYIAN